MKNIRFYKTIKPAVSRLRIAAAGMFFLAAAALAANLIMPPRLPWAVPTVTVGNNPVGIAVDAARHTIYVANALDDTVSVIDSNKCNSRNSSRCTTIATITVGPVPFYLAFDPTTDTIYATLLGPDFQRRRAPRRRDEAGPRRREAGRGPEDLHRNAVWDAFENPQFRWEPETDWPRPSGRRLAPNGFSLVRQKDHPCANMAEALSDRSRT